MQGAEKAAIESADIIVTAREAIMSGDIKPKETERRRLHEIGDSIFSVADANNPCC